MAWTTPRSWTTGEVVTATLLDQQIKGNMDLTAPAIMTTAGDIIFASASNTPARLAKDTNATRVLTNTGTSNVPAWAQLNLSSGVTSTLPVANGGTGATTLTDGGVLLGNGTGAMVAMSVLADSEMIVGDGTTDPVAESGATLRTSIGVGTGNSPEFTGLTLSGALDANGSVDFDGTTVDVDASGAVTITSTSSSANGIYLQANGGTSETIKIHADQGTSVTEGAASVSLLSDAGGIELRSTANLANAINITNDGGTTGTITVFNDQGTAATEGAASIQLLSDVGGVGIKSGLNAAGAIRLTADAGTSETIEIHADQGSGAASINLVSDAGGITMATAAGDVTLTGGSIIIGTAGEGINFSGETNTSAGSVVSEILDHYEEGTFTPTLIGNGGTAGSWAQTLASQYYIRIGSIVHISFQINVTNKGSYSGTILVSGLPFACSGNVTAGTLSGYAATVVDAALRQPEVVPSSSNLIFKSGSRLDVYAPYSELVTGYYTIVQATYRI